MMIAPAASRLAGSRCLILGGGGFIGINLGQALLAAGAKITAFGRKPHYPGHGVDRWIAAEFDDAAAISRAVADADYVFHLLGASDPGGSNRDPLADAFTTVPASLSVLAACRDAGVKKLVFISSGGTVYGPADTLPIPETAPTNPITAYGIGKLTVEKYCALFRHLHGLDYAILRVANPYGPYQNPARGQGFVAKLIQHALLGQTIEIWGDGSAIRDFIYIADVADAIVAAAAHDGDTRLFNIGSGVGRSLVQVVADVRAVVGRPVEVIHAPGRSADIPANVLDCVRAAKHLGWSATTDWTDGLQHTRDWLATTL